MARVLLIKPSALRGYQPALVPPMGLLYLAAVLRARGGHEIHLLDTRLERDWRGALRRSLEGFRPELVGLSMLTIEATHARLLSQAVRSWSPRVPVMVGGPHATARPDDTLALTGADAVVVGEGEEVVTPLAAALLDGALPDLPGVVTGAREGGDPGGPWPLQPAPAPDLDELPLPAWDLADLERYGRHQSMSSLSPWRYAPIITSRGCPWRCTYCHSIHGRRYRTRGLDSIAAELDLLQRRLGAGVIELLDDNFNASPARGKQILELFCQRGGRLRPAFPNGVRADQVDGEMLDLFVRSEARFISFAIESGDAQIQEASRKRLDLFAARRAIEGAADRGLYTNGFFMLGFPGETWAQMQRTLRFSLSAPLVQALFFRVVPTPGSALWRDHDFAGKAQLLGVDDYFLSTVNLSAVPDEVLTALHRAAYLRFYGRPRQLARIVAAVPDRSVLLSRTGALLSVLSGRRGGVHGA